MLVILISGLLAQSGVIQAPSTSSRNPVAPRNSLDPSKYPKLFSVAPSTPEFNAIYDLSQVPKIGQSQPVENIVVPVCPQASGACSWACDRCVRNTDILHCTSNQDFGLSFDDGPSDPTPQILDYLARKSVKASFFVIGSQVMLYPDILRREYEEGHQIVIHTWSHRALTSLTSEQILAELEWTAVLIKDIIGVRPTYFRPPYGDIDDRVRSIAAILGMKPVLWNYDTSDWKLFNRVLPTNSSGPAADAELIGSISAMASNWRSRNHGVISLEHDLYPATAAQAPFVIDAIMASGMNVKSVSECAGDMNPYVHAVKSIDLDLGTSIPAAIPNASPGAASLPSGNGGIRLQLNLEIFIFILLFT